MLVVKGLNVRMFLEMNPNLISMRGVLVMRKMFRLLLQDCLNLLFFIVGWCREVVLRKEVVTSGVRNADIYYYAPSGKKLVYLN